MRAAPTRVAVGALLLLLAASVRAQEGAPEAADPDAALLAQPGRALRQALEAAEDGRAERADELLQALAERHPLIADYADLERIRLYAQSGREDEALELSRAWPHADSPLRLGVQREMGRVLGERGEEAEARAAWRLALAASDESATRSALRFEIARSHQRSGQPEEAAAELLEIWTQTPQLSLDATVDENLAALEGILGRTLRNADRTRRRADAFFRARRNEEALAAYERALELGLSATGARRARSQRAHTLFRLRRYPEAAEAFAALPSDTENRIAHARSLARAGDVPRAAAQLEKIADEVRGSRGTYAKLVAALLWDDHGEVERARGLFRQLAVGRSATGRGALWRLGWEAYRSGRHEEALELLDRLEQREPHPLDALRARYWKARSLERLGRAEAKAAFAAMAVEYPFSYYGWRASARAEAPADAPAVRPVSSGTAKLTADEISRPRILLEAGLRASARDELDRLFVRAGGLDDRLALSALYTDAGDYNRPQQLMVSAYQETLARGPGAGPIELWWYAWPQPWAEIVAEATRGRAGLHPGLVYAIMREESGYRPAVRSVVGARGLLQLMPETAERVAAEEEIADFDPESLSLPSVNIRLGSAYLGGLLERFEGRATAAAASYNAGPHRVVRWLEGEPVEDDEWVEAIPYEETRNYVKRVMRSAHIYQVIY